MSDSILKITDLYKTYSSGFQALKGISLEIKKGEIFALLGPNGAGKTTLINIVCGIVTPSRGHILADGFDIAHDYRKTRTKIGLVPQELATDMFEKVWDTVTLSRGLFGKAPNPNYIEKILKDLSLWEKRNNKIRELSGGMKRRVMIAKALSHEPDILFLDEPTAGVDVELRRDMWDLVQTLRSTGVTVILTTHYIEEAEEMADRIGVINKGELILVEEKSVLMKRLGRKQLRVALLNRLDHVPLDLASEQVALSEDGLHLSYTFEGKQEETGISVFLSALSAQGILFRDLETKQSSLEEIFVNLVGKQS